MKAVQVDATRGNLKVAVDEVHQPMGEVRRKVGPEVRGAVFANAPCDIDPRPFLGCQLDVWISLVVSQQDVEARLALFDEIVLERQASERREFVLASASFSSRK